MRVHHGLLKSLGPAVQHCDGPVLDMRRKPIEEVVFEDARYSITRIGRYVRRRGVDRFKTEQVRVDRKISPIWSDWPIRAPETNELLWDRPELFAAYVRHQADLKVPRR